MEIYLISQTMILFLPNSLFPKIKFILEIAVSLSFNVSTAWEILFGGCFDVDSRKSREQDLVCLVPLIGMSLGRLVLKASCTSTF